MSEASPKLEEQWYYSSAGQVKGLVSTNELHTIIARGTLDVEREMAWREGMVSWAKLVDLEVFANAVAAARKKAKPRSLAEFNPRANFGSAGSGMIPPPPPPTRGATVGGAAEVQPAVPPPPHEHWPKVGAGRAEYFLFVVLLPVFVVVGISYLGDKLLGYEFLIFIFMAFAGMFMIAQSVRRFHNLGMSGFWLLGLLVPLLNLWLGYRLFAAPPYYACGAKMDLPGWILAVIYWLPSVVSLVATGFFVFLIATGQLDKYLSEDALIEFLKNSNIPAEFYEIEPAD